ncbi:[protein-PII] uridylyltransferase [Brevundimonas balnearis]|uniref:Bifunctional uridylyltransferase/uridylyl-removing enzyme n=1 Tax=Brevundimonas balnearis TaxID=1572858 RepID=A0ABV6R395_9CAUL
MTLSPDLAEAPDVRVAVAGALRAQYDAGRARAFRKLEGGAGGVEVARLLSQAADEMIGTLWAFTTEVLYPAPNPTEAERLAVLAVGGYGRGVLAPFSDLDLLFLRPWKTTARTESVVEFMLYVLWDLGLKVGSAVRSVDESLSIARQDMTVRTALLEARWLVGDQALAEGFLTKFRTEVGRADPRAFIAAKLEERDARHQKAGAVRYKVEPNVKDGKGGLRDLNTLFWIARALAPESPLGERVMDDLLTSRERRSFEFAFDFLWRVRAHLHLSAGRAVETLSFDLQPEVARRMGWRGRGDEPAVERFMRRYFQVARDVGALTRAMSAKLEARHQKTALSLSRLLPRKSRKLGVEGFIEDAGRLSVTGPEVFADDPVRLIELFVAADAHDLDLHPDAYAAVIRALPTVSPSLRRDPRAAAAFLHVLAHGENPYRALTLMNETGLLGRFLPEWGRIVGQTQFNMYHAYTVDEHTLQAIRVIADIAAGRLRDDHPLATEIVHRIADREALFLAMLLHDVGKGGERGQLEDGAIAARRACERLGVEGRRIEQVVWLVRHHLALSDYAQKRDVSDPATVRAFAELVGDPERLRLLLVLTVADIRAVGPGVWNSWKGRLMRDLYGQVEALFRGEALEHADPLAEHPGLLEAAQAEGAAVEVRAPEARVKGPADADESLHVTEVAVAARDRPGLFADLAEALAASGADVAGARVATTDDGWALDVFQIQDGTGAPYGQAEARRLPGLAAALRTAALGRSQVRALEIQPVSRRRAAFEVRPVVMIDTATSPRATVVEVSGADRPGLLADLARTLTEQEVSIRSAHIAAFGERAVDSFYVTDAEGRKLTSEAALDRLQTALEAVLEEGPPLPSGPPLIRARASARDVSELKRRRRRRPGVSSAAEAG